MTNAKQYGFHIDTQKCSGCKTCQVACKDKNDLDLGLLWRRVYEIGGGTFTKLENDTYSHSVFAYHVSVSCNHCNNPVCVKACPTGAMHKRNNDGLVVIDSASCIACESCARACPYDAPQIDRSKGVMTKCDGCRDRLAQGLKPTCVSSCPLRALDFDTMDALQARYPQAVVADTQPLPTSSITSPNLLITHNANNHRNDGVILNSREV